MIDLHTHTFLSDGALVPAEHIRRAEVHGYRILGISDHADLATMAWLIEAVRIAAEAENRLGRLLVVPGVELTHVRPCQYAQAVKQARALGAALVIAHGESIAEPVEAGTNRAAIEAGVDILAHPGLISLEDAKLASARGTRLEISAKAGHSLTNGHVARLAAQTGAKLMFGSDAHNPDQMPTRPYAERVCLGAGLSPEAVQEMFESAEAFARKLLRI